MQCIEVPIIYPTQRCLIFPGAEAPGKTHLSFQDPEPLNTDRKYCYQLMIKIKERRHALGITQEFIADVLDVNPSHISNIECGRANPSLTALVKIANALECSVDYFISYEYTFNTEKRHKKTLDDKIMSKIKYCDSDKKIESLK